MQNVASAVRIAPAPASSDLSGSDCWMGVAASSELVNLSTSALNVGSLFFPLTPLIGVDPDCNMTPAMLKKTVYAGAHQSFAEAEKNLNVLAEVNISSQRIRRWTETIGNERAALTAQATCKYDAMTLPARRECPDGITPPEVACIQMDGGRLQIRQRSLSAAEELATEQSNASDSEDEATGKERKGKFWKESKVSCLLNMNSVASEVDPHPVIPKLFLDPARIKRLCSEIKGNSGPEERCQSNESAIADDVQQELEETEPRIVSRHVIASRQNSKAFGAQLAATAYRLGFFAASRKSFVCDGQSANWNVWAQWFSHYTPITDFVHAICYVYGAAMAGVSAQEGWETYLQWSQWLWSGEADKIITALLAKQELVGYPQPKESKTTPRSIVAECLTYLRNQHTRMNYPEYRRLGLPTSSVYVESTIKQINRRVKGTEKFWDRAAEAILHLSADYLCPEAELTEFWAERPKLIASNRNWQKLAQTAS